MQPYSLRAFQKYQELSVKRYDLGDVSVTKQNKIPCFIDKYEKGHRY
jgi:hypothetical protein